MSTDDSYFPPWWNGRSRMFMVFPEQRVEAFVSPDAPSRYYSGTMQMVESANGDINRYQGRSVTIEDQFWLAVLWRVPSKIEVAMSEAREDRLSYLLNFPFEDGESPIPCAAIIQLAMCAGSGGTKPRKYRTSFVRIPWHIIRADAISLFGSLSLQSLPGVFGSMPEAEEGLFAHISETLKGKPHV